MTDNNTGEPTDTVRKAQRNKVPPVLRKWAKQNAISVKTIQRFGEDCESSSRGWTIRADSFDLYSLPDGFSLGRATDSYHGGVRVQVRDDS